MKLYDFQEECVEQILEGFSKHKAQCLAWYTGAGKTNVFSEICKTLVQTNPKIKIGISAYITTEIRNQVAGRLTAFGLKDHVEVIEYRKRRDPTKNIFVFNPQGIYYRQLDDVKFDYLIIDESHTGLDPACKMLRKIRAKNCHENTRILIVSATPWDVLAMKEFKDIPVYKRPLDQGLKDGLITDFKFHAEMAKITFKEEDFTRKGDLGKSAAQRQMAVLKSACVGKVKYLVDNYSKEIGSKCLVICPPGNYSEVARTLAEEIGGLAFLQNQYDRGVKDIEHWSNTDDNLKRFQEEKDQRFLFVTNKCQVGFDMQNLDSVIDLTMSRNIKVLAQRCGRIARKNGKRKKHYFYVYDQSLMKDRLEWLIATMIDFCLGAYDGWTTKTAKYRKINVSQWSLRHPFATTLSEVVKALRSDNLIENQRTLAYVTYSPPTKWTLELAKQESKKWSSRTEMWERQPALYKWFRMNAKEEMDRIFPLKVRFTRWNDQMVIDIMKGCKSRKEFHTNNEGASNWVYRTKKGHLIEKYLPPAKNSKNWTTTTMLEFLVKNVTSWTQLRAEYPSQRRWMTKNRVEMKLKKAWAKAIGLRVREEVAADGRVLMRVG